MQVFVHGEVDLGILMSTDEQGVEIASLYKQGSYKDLTYHQHILTADRRIYFPIFSPVQTTRIKLLTFRDLLAGGNLPRSDQSFLDLLLCLA